MRAAIQINDRIETATIKPYLKGDYPEPMLWVKVQARNNATLTKYVLPARLLTGKPLLFNAVQYTFLG